jgi:hypothetical protein
MAGEKSHITPEEVLAALRKSAFLHYDGTYSGRIAEEHAIEAMNKAEKLFASLTSERDAYKNALEHIAWSCEGRAVEVAKCAIDAARAGEGEG